ncbi:hypothetical protein [Granulosicoccus antarcticus]|uniref:Uncharacterized protein n=1 Tax=Granulosicoccus antarcticus IMCC3135 TaxID=1192854 RepID=A0A2Z2NRK1_9GAMM|nr:hypothetical protein [Granulosicoccus antarcticus]ASJ73983.1 hypothetical protein IMCC3135_19520 [Granulosicoccus antarcticus IMCC3135]
MTGTDDKLTATVLPRSESTIGAAVVALEALHFAVQRIIGGSLVITANRLIFSEAFDYAVTVDDQQHAFFLVEGTAISELSQIKLPSSLADSCTAVELHQPLDFGPGSFG